MTAPISRIAVAALAVTLVGCIAAPGKAPLSMLPGDGVGGPLAVDRTAGEVGVAYVTVTIGGARRTQTMPFGTKAIGLAIETAGASPVNLIKSATCGGSSCFKAAFGSQGTWNRVMVDYSGSPVQVTIAVSLKALPKTTAVLKAYAYSEQTLTLESLADPSTKELEAGTSNPFDLKPGQTANTGVTFAGTGGLQAPTIATGVQFYPPMGGPGQAVQIYGTNFGTSPLPTVMIGTTSAVVSSSQDSTASFTVPTGASKAPIYISNQRDSATTSSDFVPVTEIAFDMPFQTNVSSGGTSNTYTVVGTDSAGAALATVSVKWFFIAPVNTASSSGCAESGCGTESVGVVGGGSSMIFEYQDRAGNTATASTFSDTDMPPSVKFKPAATGAFEIRVETGGLIQKATFSVSN